MSSGVALANQRHFICKKNLGFLSRQSDGHYLLVGSICSISGARIGEEVAVWVTKTSCGWIRIYSIYITHALSLGLVSRKQAENGISKHKKSLSVGERLFSNMSL
jgi:hypothetical protein